MFEEARQLCSKARYAACMNQCRIVKFLQGGTVFDGNCICDKPIECMVNLQTLISEDVRHDYFPDVRDYWTQVADE